LEQIILVQPEPEDTGVHSYQKWEKLIVKFKIVSLE